MCSTARPPNFGASCPIEVAAPVSSCHYQPHQPVHKKPNLNYKLMINYDYSSWAFCQLHIVFLNICNLLFSVKICTFCYPDVLKLPHSVKQLLFRIIWLFIIWFCPSERLHSYHSFMFFMFFLFCHPSVDSDMKAKDN